MDNNLMQTFGMGTLLKQLAEMFPDDRQTLILFDKNKRVVVLRDRRTIASYEFGKAEELLKSNETTTTGAVVQSTGEDTNDL
jgi:hypothetical protein